MVGRPQARQDQELTGLTKVGLIRGAGSVSGSADGLGLAHVEQRARCGAAGLDGAPSQQGFQPAATAQKEPNMGVMMRCGMTQLGKAWPPARIAQPSAAECRGEPAHPASLAHHSAFFLTCQPAATGTSSRRPCRQSPAPMLLAPAGRVCGERVRPEQAAPGGLLPCQQRHSAGGGSVGSAVALCR